MSLKTLQPRATALITLILLAAAFRLLQSSNVFSFMSNVTPVGAIALFGGCYFADRWKAFIVPLLALFISDVLLNRIYYFDAGLHRQLVGRNLLERDLRAALASDGLTLDWQPFVSARTGRLLGFEALLRWVRPGHGPVQ